MLVVKPAEALFKAYLHYCALAATKPDPALRETLTAPYPDSQLEIVLNNHSLNERSFTPICLALRDLSTSLPLTRIDLGQNPYLRDSARPLFSILPKTPLLRTLLLDRTGLSDTAALHLFDLLPHTRLTELSIAHNSLSPACFERIASKLASASSPCPLSVLDVSNNKIGDRVGITLLSVILGHTRISKLGLSKTNLGYKLGVWMLRMLRESGPFALRSLLLNYNSGISVQQKQQIACLLEDQELESMGNLGDCE